jgi:glycosyltransferase involved in cell wall biosynthesis
MRTLVSILIPCYNAERWLSQAIKSALGQTWSEKEVIVVDDGSTDRSLEIIREFESRIRWETRANHGGNAARNRLLELARGEWVQYLDADDYLLADKIARQMLFVSAQANLDIVFGPVTLEHWSEQGSRRELLAIPEPHDPWILLASWKLPQTGAPLWRRRAILEVGGWKHDQPCCQEHELYLRLLIGEKHFAYCPANGAIYRQWSTQTVCKQDVSELHRRRLEIEQSLENHLRNKGLLTFQRMRAINQARFEIARAVWQYAPNLAKGIMDRVKVLDPSFLPTGPAAPSRYRFIYRCLDFASAERMAAIARRRLWPLMSTRWATSDATYRSASRFGNEEPRTKSGSQG